MNANYSTTALGFSDKRRTTLSEHQLGAVMRGNKNTVWIYVQASEAVTGTCTVDGSFALTDAAGAYTAADPFKSGEFGFVKKTAGDI
ncbi:MAG: hypothetical protein OCD03_13235 [Hyphomicrobiales bacterium]